MGFYTTKPAFRAALRPIARRAAIIPPDGWTWVAVGVCVVAGWLLALSRTFPAGLLVVPSLLFLRLLLNVLDGVIAEETHKASARGEALSEFADRLADVAVLVGFAASGWGWLPAAVASIIIVLLVSYIGILGKAVGAGRQYGGLMGKPDRMVVIMVACLVQYGVWRTGLTPPRVFGVDVTVFDCGALTMIVLGLWTIMVRVRAINRTLAARR